MSIVLRKVALIVTLVVIGVAYLGWLPREKAERFVRMMVGFFLVGFLYRFLSWYFARH